MFARLLLRPRRRPQPFSPRWRSSGSSGSAPPPPPRQAGAAGEPSTARAAAAAGAVGFGAGTLGACAGVGGAVFVIPGLVFFSGLTQRMAAGNSLVAVTCIASTSAASFASAGAVDWSTAAVLSTAAAVAAPAGALLSRRVDRNVLRKALGVLVVGIAPLMPVRSRLLAHRRARDAAEAAAVTEVATIVAAETVPAAPLEEVAAEMQLPSAAKGAGLAAAGSAIGFSAGLLGIGGGNFFTAVVACSSDVSLRTVLGTSLTAMVLPSAVAAAAYLRMGQVSVRLIPPLVVGSVGGAATGSKIALAAPETVLQWVFAIVFTLLGIRLYRAPFKPRVAKSVAKNVSSGVRPPPPRPGA